MLVAGQKAALTTITNHGLYATGQPVATAQQITTLPCPLCRHHCFGPLATMRPSSPGLARRGSEFTATSYRREAMRLLLWLQYECLGKSLSQMNVDDCGNFMAFLQNITSKWISRVHAKPGAPGWAPFRGLLSRNSRRKRL